MKISQLELGTEIFSSHLGPNLNLGYSLFKILEDGNSKNFFPKILKIICSKFWNVKKRPIFIHAIYEVTK